MAAVAYSRSDLRAADRPTRREGSDARVYRADTWSRRPDARIYRRRRAVAVLALVTIAFVAVTGVQLAWAGSGGGALTTSRSADAGVAPDTHAYVVQPGDSLWSIVEAASHGGDPRPEVDHLAAELDGRPLQPGQVLEIPGRG